MKILLNLYEEHLKTNIEHKWRILYSLYRQSSAKYCVQNILAMGLAQVKRLMGKLLN